MEFATWSEFFISALKDFAGKNYSYLVVILLLLPLSPFLIKRTRSFLIKLGRLLNVPDRVDLIHSEVQLFNGKITAILSFLGEAVKSVAFFECDIDGKCLLTTRYWSNITGLSREQSIGFGWLSAIDDADKDRVLESWLQAVEQQREWRCEFNVFHRETLIKTRLLGVSLIIKDNDSGKPVRYMRMFNRKE